MRQSLRQKPLSRFIAPMCLVLFASGALVGTYYLRKNILERTMLRAMDIADAGMMRRMARTWPAPVAVTDTEKRTPMHLAAIIGDSALIATLLDAGADAKAKDQYGCAPLHYARTIPVARALLDAGTPVDIRNANGETPLSHAVSRCAGHEAKWYVKPMSSDELRRRWPDFYLSPWGSPEIVEYLLSRGAWANSLDLRGRTPLRYAGWRLDFVGPTKDLPCVRSWIRITHILSDHGGIDTFRRNP